MTDLGLVTYFVGIEFMKTSKGLFSTQQRYIQELLEKAKMVDCKPLGTPIVAQDISSESAADYENVSFYRMLVGRLRYLTITRLDIFFAVNSVCQYLQKPSTYHFRW